MRRTLVVVDMQVHYAEAEGPYANRVVELIRRFMAGGNPIILVEFNGGGRVIKAVRDAVKGYDRCTAVVKHDTDGGGEVLDACGIHDYPLDFVVCGVSAICCVRDTSNTLVEGHPVEVVMDCTDAEDDEKWTGNARVKAGRWFTKEAA